MSVRSKRMRPVAELRGDERPPAAPMRRLSAIERRELLDRLDADALHMPLLHGDAGHLLVTRDDETSIAELWVAGRFAAGYAWPRGRPSDARLLLPAATRFVLVTIADVA